MARRKRYAVLVTITNKTEWRGRNDAFHPTIITRHKVLKWMTPKPQSQKSEAEILDSLYEGEIENES